MTGSFNNSRKYDKTHVSKRGNQQGANLGLRPDLRQTSRSEYREVKNYDDFKRELRIIEEEEEKEYKESEKERKLCRSVVNTESSEMKEMKEYLKKLEVKESSESKEMKEMKELL